MGEDYPNFDQWWQDKVVAQRRKCLVIGSGSDVRGIAVLAPQVPEDEGLPSNSLKICTFKIADASQGRKLGETMLEAVIAYARAGSFDRCFIESSEKQEPLLALLREFGFFDSGRKAAPSEDLVLVKILNPGVEAEPPTDPLEYNRRYGPGRRLVDRAFVVPIIPEYHSMLFPASEPQLSLFDSTYGNAVRKVYICHSPIKTLRPGDTLFFLRTHERQAVQAVGVVEQTLRTAELSEVLSFAGARTVYTAEELKEMSSKGLLAIKFRLDQVLDKAVGREELRMLNVFSDSPQSIAQIKTEDGLQWAKSLQDA
ncbi:GNAT family N-acetyltransferase [Paenarthrobacter ilicis]|uniref:GNAT superfamily N-acetyltransferase n=1 Tax=Paenarthrobacter ilicis TaxID=43665 RepID=A0ABX0TGP3_9MICC|nr:GNAT family N-acetyltransferase [Paenarthrobacter ilicis]MBM7791679.1 GNAT superfamily N-acetyltransferase [Paenarthrobacter ilicis]NIJ01695.1 GNAT superfamily N-acetyltransferase [Paenarthrobacter ilicis]